MGIVVPLRARRPQRQYRRAPLRQPVALVDAYGTVATGSSTDISPGGMQVVCDRYTVDSLHLSDRHLDPLESVGVDVHFKLPLNSGLVKLDAESRLVYVVPTQLDVAEMELRANGGPHIDNEFLIGLQFVQFHYSGASIVERYMQEAHALEHPLC